MLARLLGGRLTVREVLEAARDAAIAIRRIEEEAEVRREAIGVQGHTYGIHSKNGILDPMRKVDELLDYQREQVDALDLRQPIDDAWEIVAGMEKVSDGLSVELVTRYYLQGESWREIVDGYRRGSVTMPPICERVAELEGIPRQKQFRWLAQAMDVKIGELEDIGIAHLREMGR